MADGNIEYLGRIDHQVKLRGFRIELGEIESVMRKEVDWVKDCVVIAREDQQGKKRLVAYVIPAVDRKKEEPNREMRMIVQLRQSLQQKLPDFMIPSAFVLLDRFPFNPNGKLDRKALPIPEQHNIV